MTEPRSGPSHPPADSRRLVLVIGPGRSGTSTVAGALVKSGLSVPGRAIGGNPTNPSGFYEPRWVVNFHKEILAAARVGTLDSSPVARERISGAVESTRGRDRLRSWLGERFEEHPRLVVKDPRMAWFRDLWVSVARDLGVEPGFLTMLRHPAEVSASRQAYYATKEVSRREDDIRRISGWVNVALGAEADTRDSPRVFVKYTQLLADWRQEMTRVASALDLELDPPVSSTPHPVDDFIDGSLYRVRVEWSDVSISPVLEGMAERTWERLARLADDSADDPSAEEFDDLRAEYHQLFTDALALTRTETRRTKADARRTKQATGRATRPQPAQQPPSPPRRQRSLSGAWRRLRGRARRHPPSGSARP